MQRWYVCCVFRFVPSPGDPEANRAWAEVRPFPNRKEWSRDEIANVITGSVRELSDLEILTMGISQIYRVFRGTRGARILVGFAVITLAGDPKNPPLLLIHGFMGNVNDWEQVAQACSATHHTSIH